ncbi:MAG: hypothetical protein A2X94_03430 [Bdellovibrionales bacterium GWB1_55_8]|nr:MAG: hypothetical protein A2X94_03430 [Bdellovibrionales bacterium GWB1_55_8]
MITKLVSIQALVLLGLAVSTQSAFAIGVELSCNSGDLDVVHQFDSNLGHNYLIQIRNKGVIDYFNSNGGVFRNKTHVEISPYTATMIRGYVQDGAFEAVMYQAERNGKPDYARPTYVKVSIRGAGALVETYLPNVGAGPFWYFDSCR